MTLDPRIALMGQGIDTANPLQQLGAGMAEKQRYDQGIAMKQEEQTYSREQDTLDRARQEKMDAATMKSNDIRDALLSEQVVNERYKGLSLRDQDRLKSVSIAAAQLKPFLDAGDTEGALQFLQTRQTNLQARMGKGEDIDTNETDALIEMLQSGDLKRAKFNVDGLVNVAQMTGNLKTPKEMNGSGGMSYDPITGEVTYTNPPKQMPAAALKLQNEALDMYATSQNIQADLGTVIEQLDTGKLKLGPLENTASKAMNFAGASDEQSRNFSSFNSTLEKMRNDSLRLNKGVQTEGDAVRAWNELFKNPNDENLVSQRLKEIQNINQRAAELKALEVDNIRANYSQPQIDYSKYQKGSALGGQEDGFSQTPSGVRYKVIQ